MSRRGLSGVTAALLLAGAGCGGNKPVPVRGSVTLDGKPVEGAMVLFLPESEKAGRQASGLTGADGSFRLTTFRTDDGALPGNYKVVVQYAAGVEGPPAKGMREGFLGMQKAQQQGRKAPPRYVIPERFSDPARTELRQKVPPDGPVKLNLKGT
jgi:hypothetical protein